MRDDRLGYCQTWFFKDRLLNHCQDNMISNTWINPPLPGGGDPYRVRLARPARPFISRADSSKYYILPRRLSWWFRSKKA